MRVILFRSVDNLGSAGETVEVKRGYFRNFLGPRGFAREHTPANLSLVESSRKKLEAMVAHERSEANKSAEELNGIELTYELRANDKGQLFGSVTPIDVAKDLGERGHQVDRRKIEFTEPIKTLGTYPVRIRLYPEVFAEISVKVERFLRPEEIEAIEEQRRRDEKAKAEAKAAVAEEGAEAEAEATEAAAEQSAAPEAEQQA